jgi:hypothetical protein
MQSKTMLLLLPSLRLLSHGCRCALQVRLHAMAGKIMLHLLLLHMLLLLLPAVTCCAGASACHGGQDPEG